MGVVDEPGGFRAFFADGVAVEELTAIIRRPPVSVRQEAECDWAQVSRDSFPAVLVGERFFLAPPWNDDPTPERRLRLTINPGMVCGTGYHPCTQMCLDALERCLRPGDAVLDVGVGSGILSQAAILLGAGLVIGCDIDPEAVEGARERVSSLLFAGSADAVRDARFDVVVANISASAAEELAPEFARVRRSGSRLIVSGFQDGEVPEGFAATSTLRLEGWVCLILD